MGLLDNNVGKMLNPPTFDFNAGNSIAVKNEQSNTIRGNNKTTINNNESTAPAAGTSTLKPATLTDLKMPSYEDITKSTTSDIVKSLVDQITADKKVDKGEIGQLMAFLKLLDDLSQGKANNADVANVKGGNTPTADGTPSVGGVGSQAPPNAVGAPSNAADASPEAADASPKTAGASPETAGASPKTAGASPKTAGASPETAGASPETAGGSSETADAPSTDNSEAANSLKKDEDDDDDDEVNSKGASGGTQAARNIYAAMKQDFMSDGKLSSNERQALNKFAAEFGIKDEGLSQRPESAKAGGGQSLKKAIDAFATDGISEKESKAVAAMLDKGAGKNLSDASKMALAAKFAKGAVDGSSFSNQDLATFEKLLGSPSTKSQSLEVGRGTTADVGKQAQPNPNANVTMTDKIVDLMNTSYANSRKK
jgi:hypothetical protein